MSKVYSVEELNNLTVASLRDMCADRGLTGYSKKTKSVIIDMLTAPEASKSLKDSSYSELQKIAKDLGINTFGMAKEKVIALINEVQNPSIGVVATEEVAAPVVEIPKYNEESLNLMTVKNLESMAKDLGITGVSKKGKAVVIAKILETQGKDTETKSAPVAKPVAAPVVNTAKLESMIMTFTKKSGKVMVSCGANSGEFEIIGQALYSVHEFLREVLNIPQDSSYTVNGTNVSLGYIVKEGDTLEFIKKAGSKGC